MKALCTAFLGAAALTLVGSLAASAPAQAATSRLKLTVDGQVRTATVVERSRLKRQRRPVLIVLGDGLRGRQGFARASRFERFADKGGILVRASALHGEWALGSEGAAVKEVAYLRALIAKLPRETLADPRRIYVVGVGSGGIVALQAACALGRTVAGVGSISASLPASAVEACRPGRPIAALIVAGTADRRVPYLGGDARLAGYNGPVAPVEATALAFAQAASCGGKRSRVEAPNRNRADASRVISYQFAGCKAPVRLVRVEGGDHTPPVLGHGAGRPGQNRDLSATRLMLSFFRLPGA